MANAKVAWGLPTVRGSGKPQDPALIKGVEIAISADAGATWTVTDVFPPSILETVFSDLDPGSWQFRGVAIDTADRRGPEAFASVELADTSPPGALSAFVALEL
jgi:hypothetical protein